MSFRCEICGKKSLVGSNISHSHRVTKKRQKPNLQKMTFRKDGKVIKGWVCTRCIRSGKVVKVV